MSSTDLALVGVLVATLAAVAALAVTVVQLRQLVADLRRQVDVFNTEVGPSAAELSDAAERASLQVDRLEHLISVASSVTETMDSATAATVRVLSNPVIKTAALAKGTRKAARRLKTAEDA